MGDFGIEFPPLEIIYKQTLQTSVNYIVRILYFAIDSYQFITPRGPLGVQPVSSISVYGTGHVTSWIQRRQNDCL